jgi:autotransporter-associated beta strand protein
MAAPHASGALALIMERFSYMTNEQVLTVLKTTATQNATIVDATGTGTMANPEAGQQVKVPDVVNGWGTPSLRRAMNGPGQFIGPFAVNTQGQNDTWSNDISDVAIRARRAEDAAEATAWETTRQTRGWTAGLPGGASDADRSEYATGVAREAARSTRVYEGSLEKLGAGTLTLSGQNSYTGSTAVNGGTLKAGAVNAFSGASAHSVGAGGTLDLAGFSQKLPSLTNSGVVSLVGAAPGTTLTITGAYVGNNGTLRMGIVPGLGSPASDRLVLDGAGASASGRTSVQIANFGSLGAMTVGNGVELISAINGATTTAQTTKDAFAVAGGHVDAGAYEYRLYAADVNGAGENWYLRSAAPSLGSQIAAPTAREVPMLAALPEQLRQGNLAMLGSSRARMGDDDARVGRNDAGEAGAPLRSAWGRVITTNLNISQQGTVSPRSEGQLTGPAGRHRPVGRSATGAPACTSAGSKAMPAPVVSRAACSTLPSAATTCAATTSALYGGFTNDAGFYADAVLQGGRHRYTAGPLDSSPSASGKGQEHAVVAGGGPELRARQRLEDRAAVAARASAPEPRRRDALRCPRFAGHRQRLDGSRRRASQGADRHRGRRAAAVCAAERVPHFQRHGRGALHRPCGLDRHRHPHRRHQHRAWRAAPPWPSASGPVCTRKWASSSHRVAVRA